MHEFNLRMMDSEELHCYEWDDVKKPVAVLQLVHGSAEHLKRYGKFAKNMNKAGIVVVGDDHRGHGKTVSHQKSTSKLGVFAKRHGWEKLVDDQKIINDYIHKSYPFLPVFMLGHSMGSFIARTFAIKYSRNIAGLIIMGTAENDYFQLLMAKVVLGVRQLFNREQKPDIWFWKKTYLRLNKKFQKISLNANGFEWLSRDPEVQLAFVNDPLCGQIFTTSAFKDMVDGLFYNENKRNIMLMRNDIPIFIASGTDDPVGNFGQFPKKVYSKFNKLGYNVKLKLYKDYRHELLNEFGKEVVEHDIIEFIKTNRE